MIKINLLPEELRKKKKVPFIDRTFVYGLLVLIGEIVILYLVSLSQQTKIAELDGDLAEAQREYENYADIVNKQKEALSLKEELTARMNAVQELENKRAVWVQIITELRKIIPEYVWLERFEERSGGSFFADCKGYTMKSIATFLINLMNSDIFRNVQVGSINQQKIGDATGYSFTVTMALSPEYKAQALGHFEVDTAAVEKAVESGKKTKGFVETTREKLGLYGKEEAKKMFQGIND